VAQNSGPMDQFIIKPLINVDLAGIDISYTNSALLMTFAVFGTFCLFWIATRKRTIVPTRWQSIGELIYGFTASMVKDNVGKEGMRYFPFILTLFMFVFFGNVLGLMPYSFTFTSHLFVNGVLAVFIFVGVTIIGFSHHKLHYLRMFCPEGTPIAVAIVLIPIEIMSYCIRPVTLSLRLFANMLAGHVLLKVLAGFIISMGLMLGWIPFLALIAITLLEILVALIQTYVFALLATIYLNDAINMH